MRVTNFMSIRNSKTTLQHTSKVIHWFPGFWTNWPDTFLSWWPLLGTIVVLVSPTCTLSWYGRPQYCTRLIESTWKLVPRHVEDASNSCLATRSPDDQRYTGQRRRSLFTRALRHMITNDAVMIHLSVQHCARTCSSLQNPALDINIQDITDTTREWWKRPEDKGKGLFLGFKVCYNVGADRLSSGICWPTSQPPEASWGMFMLGW